MALCLDKGTVLATRAYVCVQLSAEKSLITVSCIFFFLLFPSF